MKKFILDFDLLRVGDIVCTRDAAATSKLIRSALSCDYSHVLLCVANSSCIHADGDGVHSINMQRLLFDNVDDVKILRHKLISTVSDRENVCKYARSQVGTEYSKIDATKAGAARKFGRQSKIESKYQFCSRLVAESYSAANFGFFENPSSCTPADILELKDSVFVEILNPVREASQEEVNFAKNKLINSVEKQKNITNKILSDARGVAGRDIQTFDDIINAVINNIKLDELMENIIGSSGYLTLWADDIIKCQFRYFKAEYSDSVLHDIKNEFIYREHGMAVDDFRRYKIMMDSYIKINETSPRKTIEQQINLYKTLVLLAIQRVELFSWVQQKKTHLKSPPPDHPPSPETRAIASKLSVVRH